MIKIEIVQDNTQYTYIVDGEKKDGVNMGNIVKQKVFDAITKNLQTVIYVNELEEPEDDND